MRSQAVVDHGLVDGVGLGGDLEPGGGTLALGTDRNVVQEDAAEQPGPGLAPWGLVGLDAGGDGRLTRQRQLRCTSPTNAPTTAEHRAPS